MEPLSSSRSSTHERGAFDAADDEARLAGVADLAPDEDPQGRSHVLRQCVDDDQHVVPAVEARQDLVDVLHACENAVSE
jgi:hypothetical protein